ncbi:MAG: 6-phosphofructokinase [Phycisphaerales bacterium]
MGRKPGWIALQSGVAAGADIILVPEIPFSLESICSPQSDRSRWLQHFTVIAVSEGASPSGGQKIVAHIDPTSPDPVKLGGVGKYVADQIEARTGIETATPCWVTCSAAGRPWPRTVCWRHSSATRRLRACGRREGKPADRHAGRRP